MNGVFVANEFDLANGVPTSQTPLKIAGNIISRREISDTKRRRPDAQYEQPSLFISFEPKYYIDLIPLLSTIEQVGRQVE